MALTLRQIDAFNAVMATGKLTEAARRLGVSQPAVSRLIADLETEVGFRLFDRSGRRVIPTGEAEMLITEVRRVLVGLDHVREAADAIGRLRFSRLDIVSIQSVASTLVVDVVREFARSHPETIVSIEVRGSEEVVQGVVTQQFDLGITTAEIESPAFASRTLVAGVSRCILPHGHKLADREVITPRDLAGESFISFKPDSAYRQQLDTLFAQAGISRDMRYDARTSEVICSLVAAGLGVSVVGPSSMTRDDQTESRFLVRPFEPAPPMRLSLIWSSHRPISSVARDFMDIMDAHFSGQESRA